MYNNLHEILECFRPPSKVHKKPIATTTTLPGSGDQARKIKGVDQTGEK